ncbi:MAG: HemK/PrmC family methyltransferase [Actinomycetota bacterium]
MSEPRTTSELLDAGERVLSDSSHIFEDHDNRMEAEGLLEFVLEADIDDLDPDEIPSRRERERYLSLIARRAAGEPFPILVGSIEFYGLTLEVKPGSFVPRPSSELTVSRAVKRIKKRKRPVVVDVCTGAGPIALAIADEAPRAEVWGTDIDADGLAQARRNAKLLAIDNTTFRKGDMYGSLPKRLKGKVDLITGHIPYVPPGEVDDLPAEVKDHEPLFTLSGLSKDGLGLIRTAVQQAPEWLAPGGWMLLEISEDLVPKVRKLCDKAGFEDHGYASDEDDLSVVVESRLPA